jgi:hypothetical protein
MSERDLESKGREGGAPQSEGEGGESEERASTPFDHPAFLPVLLIIFTLWFGYDGWLNPETESINFNRWGFAILLPLSVYFTIQAVRDVRRGR